jgi:hypothetical protein
MLMLEPDRIAAVLFQLPTIWPALLIADGAKPVGRKLIEYKGSARAGAQASTDSRGSNFARSLRDSEGIGMAASSNEEAANDTTLRALPV